MKKTRVLVVDDSALMRRVISDIVSSVPDLEVAATARNGLDALEKIKNVQPDVITLDVEMPEMDGIETLRHIMKMYRLPVIMVSNLTRTGSESTLKALALGAIDFIQKPAAKSRQESLEELRSILPMKIRAAAAVRPKLIAPQIPEPPALLRKAPLAGQPAKTLLAIGASTGGPKALEKIFSQLPANFPAGVIISLHMPPGFTATFANRLNAVSPLHIKEAAEGDVVAGGKVLVAPGGFHLKIKNGAAVLDSGPKVNYVRPSIDVMLESLCDYPHDVIVLILTGMGKDGAAGAAYLQKEKAGTVIMAQSPESALIPSMPEAVTKSTAVTAIVPLDRIASEIIRLVNSKGQAAIIGDTTPE